MVKRLLASKVSFSGIFVGTDWNKQCLCAAVCLVVGVIMVRNRALHIFCPIKTNCGRRKYPQICLKSRVHVVALITFMNKLLSAVTLSMRMVILYFFLASDPN